MQLGHYRIVSLLGAGGMGEVYEAEDTRLHRRVAIKLLPASVALDDAARQRLLREAQAIAAIDHPNVCTVYELGEAESRPYIVMQFVQGETLADRMSRGRMSLQDVLTAGIQIAEALEEAHRRGVIHRDIKPANVMVTPQGTVKVLDFGIAKPIPLSEVTEVEVALTAEGAVAGTPPYMSPEQLRGELLDARSDIFSLGVVLYEMISGHRPFDRGTAVATISAILFEDPPPLDAAEQHPMEKTIRKALAKERQRRYQSAAELAAALRAPAKPKRTKTVASRPTTSARTPSRPRTQSRRRPVDPEVEQLCLRGRLQWNKRHPPALKEAISLFQQALERDPSYAGAYAGLADCYSLLAFVQAAPAIEMVPKAKAAAQRALELNTTFAQPHATLGYIAGMFEWNPAEAEKELREAMQLDSSYPWAPHWLALILVSHGRFDDALVAARQAEALDPLSPILTTAVGLVHHLARNYSEALRVYHRVVETESAFAPAHYYLGLTFEQLSRYDEAVAHLRQAAEISRASGVYSGALAHSLAAAGEREEATRIIDAMRAQADERYVSPFNLFVALLGRDGIDAALPYLAAALEERSGWLAPFGVDPRFDAIRADPRVIDLCARHGLRYG